MPEIAERLALYLWGDQDSRGEAKGMEKEKSLSLLSVVLCVSVW